MVDIKQILAPKKIPLLNEPYIVGRTTIYDDTSNHKTFMTYFKKSPEAMGIISKLVSDINSSFSFKALPSPRGKGRPNMEIDTMKETRAMLFAKKNFLGRELDEQNYDLFVTGNFYCWIGKINKSELRGKLDKDAKKIFDEDYDEINFIRTVSSTTMSPKYDETDVLAFRQNVNGKVREWSEEEIIHGKLMHLDGKVEGFTPFEAAYSIITTIGLIKDYCGNFFASGGIPDTIFSFPEEMSESPSYKKIAQVLQEYADAQRRGLQKRGHIVIAGKVEVEKLNEFNKDMEFRQLLLTYVGILAFSFRMPSSMLKAILGAEVKESSGGTDTSESDYWRHIRKTQEYIEELYNSQLWRPYFGVEMILDKKYLVDEIKESQNLMFKADVLAKQNAVLMQYDMKVDENKVFRMLELEKSDVRDLTDEEKQKQEEQQMLNMPMNRQGQPDKKAITGGESTDKYRGAKKSEQDKKKV